MAPDVGGHPTAACMNIGAGSRTATWCWSAKCPLPPAARVQGRRTLRVTFIPHGPRPGCGSFRNRSIRMGRGAPTTILPTPAARNDDVNAGSPRHHIDVVVFASAARACRALALPGRSSAVSRFRPFVRCVVCVSARGRLDQARRPRAVCRRSEYRHVLQQGPVLSPAQAERPRRSVRMVCRGGGGDRRDARCARARGDRSAARRRFPSRAARAIPTATCGSGWCSTTCRTRQTPIGCSSRKPCCRFSPT